jgi:hypothetical protein
MNLHHQQSASTTLFSILGQLLKFIPHDITHQLAKARRYNVLSHSGTMLFVQLSHALSLSDVCDRLRLKTKAPIAFGGTPPSRNSVLNSNKVRDAKFAGLVFRRT